MKKTLPLLAAFLLGGVLASGTAGAVPVSSYYYTNTLSQTVTNTVYRSTNNFIFNKFNEFDPAKGGLFDLLGVTVTINSSTLTGNAWIRNDGQDPVSVSGYSSSFTVSANNSLGYNAFSNSFALVGTTPDWTTVSVASGETKILTLNSGQYFVDPNSPNVQDIASAFFSAYSGVGTIAFALRNPMNLASDGESYVANTSGAGALTSMTVTYTYGVPEPSTYALLGMGGLALVVAWRRRVA